MVHISGHRPSLLELIKSYGEGPKATADLRGLLTETSTDPAIINPSGGERPITVDKIRQGLSNIAERVDPGGRINTVGGTPRQVLLKSQPPRTDDKTMVHISGHRPTLLEIIKSYGEGPKATLLEIIKSYGEGPKATADLQGLLTETSIATEVNKTVTNGIGEGRKTSNAALAAEQFRKDQDANKVGEEIIMESLLSSSSNNKYQPTTGWDRLFATLAGMGGRGSGGPIGTSGFNAFLGDFVGSSQDLATQEAKAAADLADRSVLEADLADKREYRNENLRLRQETLDLQRHGKPPSLNKDTIEAMEDYLDTSGLDYTDFYKKWWSWMDLTTGEQPSKETAKTAIASAAVQLQMTDPLLIGNPKEALRQAIKNLSGAEVGSVPSVVPSISNAASVNIVN